MAPQPIRVLIIGAGSRGNVYAWALRGCPAPGAVVTAVAEPIAIKRRALGRKYIWGNGNSTITSYGGMREGQEFADWHEFLEYETARRVREAAGQDVPPGVDAVFVCLRDELHREVVVGLAPLRLHIMCEKPLATNLEDCKEIHQALLLDKDTDKNAREQAAVFSVGHVLRYTPHNGFLRKLLREDRVIGDIMTVVHTEPVGWWHFTHSYVRGNWRNAATTGPSLLTKSCHDIDLLMWMLSAPVKAWAGENLVEMPHMPSTITSSGRLGFFNRTRKPAAAGAATNCMTCPLGDDANKCRFSARHIYISGRNTPSLASGRTGWPVNVVVPEIEDLGGPASRVEAIEAELAKDYDAATADADEVASKNWFGRCVFESDNNVCDDQIVTLTWDPESTSDGQISPNRHPKTAVFHMSAQTAAAGQRRTHYYGTNGELTTDSHTIRVTDFMSSKERVYTANEYSRVGDWTAGGGHGGGDVGLVSMFIAAVDAVKNTGWTVDRAQREFVGCTLDEAIMSHFIVFAAEDARTKGEVVKWADWAAERLV